jgi:hypothetical protein
MCYVHVLDLFRNGPLVNDDSPIGTSVNPPYATAQTLFNFVVSELNACQTNLISAKPGYSSTTYGHANQAAAWALLARLYLNADTYLGTTGTTQYYTNCIDNCNKIIAAGYSLEPNYSNLFVTDNYRSNEIIFPNIYDGTNLTTWGGLMFLECGSVNSRIQSVTNAPGGWGGNRATQEFVARFSKGETNCQFDQRYSMLHQDGYSVDSTFTDKNNKSKTDTVVVHVPAFQLSIDDNTQFTQGTPLLKFDNHSSAGVPNKSSFATGAFPLFRLGDVYLMYAEAVLRGGSDGNAATALSYINALRDRADNSGAGLLEITSAQLTLPFILEERAREMFAEAVRRTDLVRFGMLTSPSYLWQWKGGVKTGTGVDSHWNVYPLPSSDLSANSNLKQNPGY